MIFNFKRNSVIWQLTASFLLILLMPIMCNVLIYKEIRKDIRQELTEKNNIFFRNISKSIEISLKDYSQAVSELSVKPAVLNLCAAPSPDEITPELVNDFKDSLKPYYRTMYNAYKFYCCFNNSGMIGTTAGIEDKETFFASAFDGLAIDFSDWDKWTSSPSGDIRVVKGTGSFFGVMPKYILMKYRMNENAIMVLVMRDVYFSYNIDKMLDNKAIKHEIFSADGQLLSTTLSSDDTSAEFIGKMVGQSGNTDIELDGKPIVASYTTINSPGWKLVFYTPEYLYQPGRTGMRLVFLFMAVTVVLGIVLIPLLVKHQYTPVRRILNSLPDESEEKKYNEYAMIENALFSLSNQQKSLQKKQQTTIRNDFWLKILNGVFTSFHDDDVKKYLKPSFSALPDTVALIPMDIYADLFSEEDLHDYMRFDFLMTILENIGGELLDSQGIENIFLESGGNCIILLRLGSPDASEKLEIALQNLIENMRKHFSLETCISVSMYHDDLYGLATAYCEALSGIDYIRFVEKNELLFYEDIAKNQVQRFIPETEEVNTLCKYIKYAETENACDYTDRLILKFTHSANFRPAVFKYYVNDIVNTIIRNFQQYIDDNSSEIQEIYILTLSASPDMRTVQDRIKALIHSICKKIKNEMSNIETDKDSQSELALKIRDYIDSHYTDPDMCANMVAMEFKISTPYISKIFKTVQPEGFIKYINHKRIEKAKELLKPENAKIADVAEQTGFSNTTSFVRLFKTVEGVSPSTYRKFSADNQD